MQSTSRNTRPTRLQEQVLAIVGFEIIAGVSGEQAGLRVDEAPVGAEVGDGAGDARTGEVAAHDGDGFADSAGALRFVEGVGAVDEGGVEEVEGGWPGCFEGCSCGGAFCEGGEREERGEDREQHDEDMKGPIDWQNGHERCLSSSGRISRRAWLVLLCKLYCDGRLLRPANGMLQLFSRPRVDFVDRIQPRSMC